MSIQQPQHVLYSAADLEKLNKYQLSTILHAMHQPMPLSGSRANVIRDILANMDCLPNDHKRIRPRGRLGASSSSTAEMIEPPTDFSALRQKRLHDQNCNQGLTRKFQAAEAALATSINPFGDLTSLRKYLPGKKTAPKSAQQFYCPMCGGDYPPINHGPLEARKPVKKR
ncbi:hypothetical protein BV898_05143 [Hypsibius exemplaris]|uniref:SAP domain-containing protein n=1 Tax=Hypsibius exemplaris TaxID=2072580 RepID=A0A1W0X006_HYPEX|nr:hypothetical protein BV898_05143 [Hypsibius exemplaris]